MNFFIKILVCSLALVLFSCSSSKNISFSKHKLESYNSNVVYDYIVDLKDGDETLKVTCFEYSRLVIKRNYDDNIDGIVASCVNNDGSIYDKKYIKGYQNNNKESLDKKGASKDSEISNDLSSSYKIGSGDKLRITVFNEEDLSGEFEVDSSGILSLPLIGVVNVEGLTISEITSDLVGEYSSGYLKSPKVNIEVLNYRPFFIIGEVNNPGSYPYVSGISLVNAVALAGGYTYRAKKNSIIITRNKKKIEVDGTAVVFPGDSILVKQRLF